MGKYGYSAIYGAILMDFLTKELAGVVGKSLTKNNPVLVEGTIISQGTQPGQYDIELLGGRRVYNVKGSIGLSIGDRVVLGAPAGSGGSGQSRFTIISDSKKGTYSATTVIWV